MYYTIESIKEYLELFNLKDYKIRKQTKTHYEDDVEVKEHLEVYNIPCAFDIETTNTYINKEDNKVYQANKVAELREKLGKNFKEEEWQKFSFMYIWMLSIDDKIIIGRTWKEYKDVIKAITEYFKLTDTRKLIFYVHNLAFEFQFLKSIFDFTKVFATESHKVIYADMKGFQYRCSYFLGGAKLETLGKNLTKYKAEKQTGLLDYNLIRTSDTILTEDEIKYCLYDVIVLSNFIRESMEQEKKESLLKLPLTKTGYVRRYCKKYCLNGKENFSYKKVVQNFEYNKQSFAQLQRCYAGAFTHANALNVGKIFENVHSQDFTSSYPFCLLAFKYPVGKAIPVKPKTLKEFYILLNKYACIFDIRFKNIRMKDDVCENIISLSKCFKFKNVEENNGRVVSADVLCTTINEVDFHCINQFYDYDEIDVINDIANMKKYRKDYLPKPLLECIIHFYKGKTELKDVIGKENEYQLLKAMLNSIYGMCVTNPIHDSYLLDELNQWITDEADIESSLEHYNNSTNRFIAYEWGIWCTSYGRCNLFSGIKEMGPDYIYSDTDSIKYLNFEKHQPYFEKYNTFVENQLKKMCKARDVDFELLKPKTIQGKEKLIGVFDYEGCYTRFKTLGAKRYAVEEEINEKVLKGGSFVKYNNKMVSITVSGVNKKTALPYLVDLADSENKDFFEVFEDELYVDINHSGKLLHTYIDLPIYADVIDYQGNKTECVEFSSVHLEPTSYSLGLSDIFVKYLRKINTKYKRAI